MGGHGGLNILPQKSWNVYNRSNRERVARDEALAAQQAASEAAIASSTALGALRERVGLHGGSSTTHVNFFADVEEAERNAEREAARKRAEAREIARIMPDLDLSKSAREPAPWYTRAPSDAADELRAAVGRPDAASACHFEMGHVDVDMASSAVKRKHEHRKEHKHDKRDKHDKRSSKQSRRAHAHERRVGADEPDGRTADSERIARLRSERIERERREQSRAHVGVLPPYDAYASRSACGSGSSGSTFAASNGGAANSVRCDRRPACATAGEPSRHLAGVAPEAQPALLERFMSLTGQGPVTLKPRRWEQHRKG